MLKKYKIKKIFDKRSVVFVVYKYRFWVDILLVFDVFFWLNNFGLNVGGSVWWGVEFLNFCDLL